MTVSTQMEQVITGIQSAAASLKSFALETQDQQAKSSFEQAAATLEGVIKDLEKRKQFIEVKNRSTDHSSLRSLSSSGRAFCRARARWLTLFFSSSLISAKVFPRGS